MGTTAVVQWRPPEAGSPSLEVQGYRLQFGRKDVTPLATLEFTAQEQEYTVGNVHRGATYVFKISAKSRSGFGEEAWQELTVPEEVPKGYPQISEGPNVTCCSVQLSWLPPMLAERNGAITEYTLAFKEAGSAASPRELTLPASESGYTVNGLNPDSAYEVKIRAHTSVGPGPYSPPMQCKTLAFQTGRVCLFLFWGGKHTEMKATKQPPAQKKATKAKQCMQDTHFTKPKVKVSKSVRQSH